MRGKCLTALCLTLGMVSTTVLGCGSSETLNSKDTEVATDIASSSDTEDQSDAASDKEDEDEDAEEITVALMSLAPVDEVVADQIESDINKITESEINVHVNFKWYDGGTYGSSVTMMIQGGEDLDLMMFTPIPGASYSSFLSAGQLMNITDILEEYGQDIMDIQGERIKACELNGSIYGVCNNRNAAAFENICIRKDVLEETGHLEDAENATTWTEVEAILKDIADAGYTAVINCDADGNTINPGGFNNASDNFSENYSIDDLGDGYGFVTTNEETDQVECLFMTDDYETMVERACTWYEEGLIYKDAANAQDYGDTLLKNEVGVVKVSQQETGPFETMKSTIGYEFVGIRVTDMKLSTSSLTIFGYSVPVTAKQPEAAVKFLNLLYTSEDMMNTLTYGREGTDWILGDDGLATYPEGVTGDTVAYHQGDFLYGNQFIAANWDDAVSTREELQAEDDAVVLSKYFGFQLDNTGLENLVTACYNVEQQYASSLSSGQAGSNWKTTLEEFRSALKQAGIDELMAAYQEQLDTWLAEQ